MSARQWLLWRLSRHHRSFRQACWDNHSLATLMDDSLLPSMPMAIYMCLLITIAPLNIWAPGLSPTTLAKAPRNSMKFMLLLGLSHRFGRPANFPTGHARKGGL